MCILLSTGCNMPSGAAPERTSQVLSTPTSALNLPPVAKNTPITAPTVTITDPALSTETPETKEGTCTALLVPSEGVVYPLDEEIKFIWEAMLGAGKYLLEISNSTGWMLSIETTSPNCVVSADLFPGAMSYSWTVVVFDSAGKQICRVGPSNFSLTIKRILPTEKPDKGEGSPREGSGDGGDDGGDEGDFSFLEW